MAIENTINYALRVIKPVIDGDATTVEVKREAEIQFSQQMQQDLHKTVWWGGCVSWYNTKGRSGKKWNAMSYPHSQMYYWYKSLFPAYQDWNYTVRPAVAAQFPLSRCKQVSNVGLVDTECGAPYIPAKGPEAGSMDRPPARSPPHLAGYEAIRRRLPLR
ncbi:hypothetical protein TOPH_09149 [Tolypocladium ophioglossoides CBS 100239]|uniref:Uncharacterized protein n=1 Tax=Tolypocladium ophioglossoides (strain CBS 100239) TaxID=1163406 RepID=A0A0L0MXL9_TOLOC|nr:hypothetical protein TOPH_09149 [Tolypocladium ophioglossoides CBS 100239]